MPTEDIQERLRQFARDRNWGQFHNPKNLVMALTGEVGELSELFQWLTEKQSAEIMSDPKKSEMVRHEIADVYLYLLLLADVLKMDIEQAAIEKIDVNSARYPIEKSLGNSKKYTDH